MGGPGKENRESRKLEGWWATTVLSTQHNTRLFLGLNVYQHRAKGQFIMPFYTLRFNRHYRMPHYRQDSSPSCCNIAVNTNLNYKYSERAAGRCWSIEWPSKSPDLPHSTYIYVTLFKVVFTKTVYGVVQLQQRIVSYFVILDISECLRELLMRYSASSVGTQGKYNGRLCNLQLSKE